MEMPLISVIVPVYKTEAYLDRCVQSIADQTYKNLEIILVDDGSPDNCPAICDAWAEKDSRVKVVHKQNGGSAQARNVGLELASGQYIGFVDSDDFVLPEMYTRLYQSLIDTDSDIAECGYYTVINDASFPETHCSSKLTVLNTVQALEEHIRNRRCTQVVWNKLYRKETIDSVRFIEGKTIDDEFFTYRVLANATQVAVLDQTLYCYRQQPDSIMHQKFSMKRLQAIEAKTLRLEYIQKNFPELEKMAKSNLLFACLYNGQMSYLHLNAEQQTCAFEMLEGTMKKCNLHRADFHDEPFMSRCWSHMAVHHFRFTCKLRNLLGVGQ